MARSVLRIRQEPHTHPARREEAVIEVVRDGEVVAMIYGSREGVHITSMRLDSSMSNTPFRLDLPLSLAPVPGFVIPLLAEGEACPWCNGVGLLKPDGALCPACHREVTEYHQ
jgi:hypothetical protein